MKTAYAAFADQRRVLLELLERDWRGTCGLVFCDSCEILHSLGRLNLRLPTVHQDDHALEGKILFGNGAYRVAIEYINAAVLYRCQGKITGFCVELLRCRGKQKLEIECSQIQRGEEARNADEEMAEAMEIEKDGIERYYSGYTWGYSDALDDLVDPKNSDDLHDTASKDEGLKSRLSRFGLI